MLIMLLDLTLSQISKYIVNGNYGNYVLYTDELATIKKKKHFWIEWIEILILLH